MNGHHKSPIVFYWTAYLEPWTSRKSLPVLLLSLVTFINFVPFSVNLSKAFGILYVKVCMCYACYVVVDTLIMYDIAPCWNSSKVHHVLSNVYTGGHASYNFDQPSWWVSTSWYAHAGSGFDEVFPRVFNRLFILVKQYYGQLRIKTSQSLEYDKALQNGIVKLECELQHLTWGTCWSKERSWIGHCWTIMNHTCQNPEIRCRRNL